MRIIAPYNLEPRFMRSALSPANHDRAKGKRIAFVLPLAFFLMPVVCGRNQGQPKS